MHRRGFMRFLASLPFVGSAFVRSDDDWRTVVRAADVPFDQLFARNGEWVTCANGHRICQFTRDVVVGEMFDPAAMGNWQRQVPRRGTMHYDALCTVHEPGAALPCGAEWFHGTSYHFADGWR